MHRRALLALAVPLLAGCSSATSEPSSENTSDDPENESEPSTGTDGESQGVSDVALVAEGVQASDPDVSLAIQYNSRAAKELQTGQTTTVADDGEKWLGVRMAVTNTGTSERELIVRHYTVSVAGQEYEPVYFDKPYSLRGQTVAPGEMVTGWAFYSIPIEATGATLRANQGDLTRFDVTFAHEPSLDVTSSDG